MTKKKERIAEAIKARFPSAGASAEIKGNINACSSAAIAALDPSEGSSEADGAVVAWFDDDLTPCVDNVDDALMLVVKAIALEEDALEDVFYAERRRAALVSALTELGLAQRALRKLDNLNRRNSHRADHGA